MAYDEDNAIYVWPEYFDISRTRAEGRRVSKSICVKEPSLDIIAKGAMLLDLEYVIIEDSAYPSNWTAKRGCVRIEKGKLKKTKLLSEIGKCLVANQ